MTVVHAKPNAETHTLVGDPVAAFRQAFEAGEYPYQDKLARAEY